MEDKISARKAEVEKLIKEMRDANMESLAISPPEESKQFMDGEFYLFNIASQVMYEKCIEMIHSTNVLSNFLT